MAFLLRSPSSLLNRDDANEKFTKQYDLMIKTISLQKQWLCTCVTNLGTLGSFSNDDGDDNENVKKANRNFFVVTARTGRGIS